MDVSPDDRLAASVFATGLLLNFVGREDVVRWADRRIESVDTPPGWLIDLSLSQNLFDMDLISLLRRVGTGTDPVATCKAAYALAPDVAALSFDEAARLAKRLYLVTNECLGYRRDPLRREADNVDDTFDLARDDVVFRDQAVLELRAFLERHADERVKQMLGPAMGTGPLY